MSPQDFVYMLGDLANFSAIPGVILFIIFYLWKSKWREFPAGRSLMYFASALGVTALSGFLVIVFGPDYFLREWVRLALFIIISATIWRMFVVLRQVQTRPPRTVDELQAMIDALMIAQREHPHRPVSRDNKQEEG